MFRNSTFCKIGQKGQSTVEYILLFAVVASLASLIFKSDAFKKLFGPRGDFANAYRLEMEFSYRHAYQDRKPFETPNYKARSHDSFTGGSFFGARDAYPKQ